MAIKCGHCKEFHDTVAEVRTCAGARPDATVAEGQDETSVERRGENYFVTPVAQNLYDNWEDEMARQQEEVHKDRMAELTGDHPGHGESFFNQPAESGDVRTEPLYLNCPFSEKDEAKRLGAKWDPQKRQWYVPVGIDTTRFRKWIPGAHVLGPVEGKAERPQPTTTQVTEDGVYKHGSDIYKVKWNQAQTSLYASKLVVEGEGKAASVSFEYAPGMINRIDANSKLTEEEAAQFGKLYGSCCICARTLTNEVSIERGIGPICAEKMGW